MIRIEVVSIVTALLLWSCASQIGPSGGEVDKIPPKVESTYPTDKTVNFSDNYVLIEFDEYVDKRSVQEAIFISPAIDGKIEYDWSGRELEIIFEDSLRKNITYSITIGTDVIDLNNRNNMASSYSFTFSTGEEIDVGQVEGNVFAKNALGTLVFAYALSDTIPNPATQKPDYLSQVGVKGEFLLRGMGTGRYRLFAVKDEFRDLLYNATDDMFGVPEKDIELSREDSIVTGLNFMLSIEDTTAPSISNITNTDRNHILVEFTEAIDSTKLSPQNFFVYDSTESKSYPVVLIYKDNNKSQNYFACISDSLNVDNENYIVAQGIFDKKGNQLVYESFSFVASDKVDTLAPSVKSVSTEYTGGIIDFMDPYFDVRFDDGVIITDDEKAFTLLDGDSLVVSISVAEIDAANKRIRFNQNPRPNREFEFIVDYGFTEDAAGNSKDTTFNSKLSTISELEFSAVSGIVESDSTGLVKLVLENLTDNKTRYRSQPRADKSFSFERVKPGNYLLIAFIDRNNNSQLDLGTIDPFQYSEKFVYYPDTLKLNARWPVGDVQVDIK